MRCLSCQYDLSHLTEHRCPECGRAFDPSDPSTFNIATNKSKDVLIRIAMMATVSYVLTFLLAFRYFVRYGELFGYIEPTTELILIAAVSGLLYFVPMGLFAVVGPYMLVYLLCAELARKRSVKSISDHS